MIGPGCAKKREKVTGCHGAKYRVLELGKGRYRVDIMGAVANFTNTQSPKSVQAVRQSRQA
jgi:hypothetical protein